MLNILTEHNVAHALVLGGIFLGVILSILVIGYLWTWIWAYLDDGDSNIKNPAFALFKGVAGFYPVRGGYGSGYLDGYVRNKECDGYHKHDAQVEGIKVYTEELIQMGVPVLIFLLPILTLLAVTFYPVPLTIFTLYSIMFVARSGRRLSKKFTSHTIDPNAHKEEI